LLVCCFSAVAASAADTITGKVRNETAQKPAAGDEVVLLRLENGMEQEARTKTDAQGGFVLPLATASAGHLVRVLHQGVNYDTTLNGNAPLDIEVFDAVTRIKDLQGRLGITQVESDGQMLKITEMYDITNDAIPPVTQAGPRNFEISIAANATVDAIGAKRDGGLWVNVKPVPIKGQPGRYAVDFPIRPGDTLFKCVYHLPYTGPTTLHVKPAYPLRSFAVMHPPSLTFKSSVPQAFRSPGLAKGLKIEMAMGKTVVRNVAAFEVSGIGVAPPDQAAQPTPPANRSMASAAPTPVPASAVVPPRPESGVWAIVSGVIVLLAAGLYAGWKLRKSPVSRG
jgi:hypothetical protein